MGGAFITGDIPLRSDFTKLLFFTHTAHCAVFCNLSRRFYFDKCNLESDFRDEIPAGSEKDDPDGKKDQCYRSRTAKTY